MDPFKLQSERNGKQMLVKNTHIVRYNGLPFHYLLHVTPRVSRKSEVVLPECLIKLDHYRIALAYGHLQHLDQSVYSSHYDSVRTNLNFLQINEKPIGSIYEHGMTIQ